MASYKELIHHNNDIISERWMTGGENEFGRLFQGFKQNEIDGLAVLIGSQNLQYQQIKQ